MEKEATLKEGEAHPAAYIALHYLNKKKLDIKDWLMIQEAIASTALSGNRTADICLSTLKRLEKGEPVSDRYLMGLAWQIYQLENG